MVRRSTISEWVRPWGVVTLPCDARCSTRAWGEGLAISAEAQHLEACWQWVAFLSEQMPHRPPSRCGRRSCSVDTRYTGAESVTKATRRRQRLRKPDDSDNCAPCHCIICSDFDE